MLAPRAPNFNVESGAPQNTKNVFYFAWPAALQDNVLFNIEIGGAGGEPKADIVPGVFYFANTGTLENFVFCCGGVRPGSKSAWRCRHAYRSQPVRPVCLSVFGRVAVLVLGWSVSGWAAFAPRSARALEPRDVCPAAFAEQFSASTIPLGAGVLGKNVRWDLLAIFLLPTFGWASFSLNGGAMAGKGG